MPEQYIDAALASVPVPDSEWWRRGSVTAGDHRIGREGPTFFPLNDNHDTLAYMDAAIMNTVSKYYKEPKPDHSYAGLFQMLAGSSLSPHRDHNTCRNKRFRRRIALVLFLNDPDGGDFQMWDPYDGLIETVTPVRGRLIMFDANRYHAVTEVAEESRRLTLALHMSSRVTKEDSPPHDNMTWLADDFPEVFEE